MPQGKGTYGSKVGRPSKKKYQVGGEVEPNFPLENDAIKDANKLGQDLKSIPLEWTEPEFPISNATERSVKTYEVGGRVEAEQSDVGFTPDIMKTGLEQIRGAIPYKKGGKVKI